jgi:uncharacterized protein YtpQ (UPF0354 family)
VYININKLLKNDKLKPEHKVKKKLEKKIRKTDDVIDFIHKFHELTVRYNWKWRGMEITIDWIIEHLVNDTYRIIKAEVDYRNNSEDKKFKEDNWVISCIGSGRLLTRPTEFDTDKDNIWIDIEYCTTL